MTSGKSPSESRPQTDTQVVADRSIVESLSQFEIWINNELDELVRKNQQWQTNRSNRKFFGR